MSNPQAAAAPRVRVVAGNAAPLVLVAGLASTALALVGVWALSRFAGENVMGWYANYVIPAGAILVGLVASSGFGAASWKTGTKVTGPLLLAVAVVLVGGYWCAKYVEFRLLFPDGAVKADGSAAGFLDYYDAATRTFAWVEHGKHGAPLGVWGYAIRVGEVIGFSGGGLAIPLFMRKLPYCAVCALYKRSPVVALLPAGLEPKRISKKDAGALAAREAEAKEAFARGQAALERLLDAGRKGDAAAFGVALAEEAPRARKRATEKLAARIQVKVVHCPRCAAGEIRASVMTGQGKQLKVTPLAAEGLEQGVAPRLLARARHRVPAE